MAKFQYDKNGNITPYQLHSVQHSELMDEFVVPYKNSITRKDIHEGHNNYILDLYGVIETNFTQWLDGSYITQKENPNDIDVVNFVAWNQEINDNIINLEKFLTHTGTPKTDYKVDGYLVPVYDRLDPRFEYTLTKYEEWRLFLGKDRQNNPKGILQLDIINNGY